MKTSFKRELRKVLLQILENEEIKKNTHEIIEILALSVAENGVILIPL